MNQDFAKIKSLFLYVMSVSNSCINLVGNVVVNQIYLFINVVFDVSKPTKTIMNHYR